MPALFKTSPDRQGGVIQQTPTNQNRFPNLPKANPPIPHHRHSKSRPPRKPKSPPRLNRRSPQPLPCRHIPPTIGHPFSRQKHTPARSTPRFRTRHRSNRDHRDRPKNRRLFADLILTNQSFPKTNPRTCRAYRSLRRLRLSKKHRSHANADQPESTLWPKPNHLQWLRRNRHRPRL